MLNYISSELYKTFRRKYTKISLAVIALLCVAGNALIRMTFSIVGISRESILYPDLTSLFLTLLIQTVFIKAHNLT